MRNSCNLCVLRPASGMWRALAGNERRMSPLWSRGAGAGKKLIWAWTLIEVQLIDNNNNNNSILVWFRFSCATSGNVFKLYSKCWGVSSRTEQPVPTGHWRGPRAQSLGPRAHSQMRNRKLWPVCMLFFKKQKIRNALVPVNRTKWLPPATPLLAALSVSQGGSRPTWFLVVRLGAVFYDQWQKCIYFPSYIMKKVSASKV